VQAITFAAVILPGEEEGWRRFVQELAEERLHEYGELRRRVGIRNEAVWLACTPRGEVAIAYLEAEDPERIVAALAASEEPFDLWFKGKISKFHDSDLACKPRRSVPELIFRYQDVPEATQ
jgi:hypothetical protein